MGPRKKSERSEIQPDRNCAQWLRYRKWELTMVGQRIRAWDNLCVMGQGEKHPPPQAHCYRGQLSALGVSETAVGMAQLKIQSQPHS